MLERLRTTGRRLLRRRPTAYAWAKRAYGAMSYFLGVPHDEDFAFFRNLEDQRGLVADIGANGGQSARSIRLFNRSLDILSFEPNPLMEPDLRWTRHLLGRKFDYRLFGLGSAPARLTLYVPLVGRTPQTPWATTSPEQLETNRAYIEADVGGPFSVAEVEIEIRTFDELDLHPLAVKIDVEGLEIEVLKGLQGTLSRNEPVLMLEGSAGTGEVIEYLAAFGYAAYAYRRETNQLDRAIDACDSPNFFACTPGRVAWLVERSELRLIGDNIVEHAAAEAAG